MILIIETSLIAVLDLSLLYTYFFKAKNEIPFQGIRKIHFRLYGLAVVMGFVIALIIAVIESWTVWINREYMHIIVLGSGTFFQLLFLACAWKNTWGKKSVVFSVIELLAAAGIIIPMVVYTCVDILLMPGEFLLDGSSFFSTDLLFKVIGYSIGLVAVFLAGLGLVQTIKKHPTKTVLRILSVVLLLGMFQAVMLVLKPLMARQIVPMIRWLFLFLVFVLNHANWFIYAPLALILSLIVRTWVQTYTEREYYKNPAEHRKIRAEKRRVRRWCKTEVLSFLFFVLSLTVINASLKKEIVLSPSEEITIVNDEIQIPLEQVDDGTLHRFTYETQDGIGVRFIIIKKSLSAYGIGLDACEICGPTGYYEGKQGVVCKRCDVVMNIATIGFKGGCNPIPFDYRVDNGQILIKTETLDAQKKWFKN